MIQTKQLLSHLMTTLSVVLSFGVTAHDTQVGHAVAVRTSYGISTTHSTVASVDDLRSHHTHTDYNPLSQALRNAFAYQSPSIAPRRHGHHKQLLRTLELGGRHAFDDVHLPVVS